MINNEGAVIKAILSHETKGGFDSFEESVKDEKFKSNALSSIIGLTDHSYLRLIFPRI